MTAELTFIIQDGRKRLLNNHLHNNALKATKEVFFIQNKVFLIYILRAICEKKVLPGDYASWIIFFISMHNSLSQLTGLEILDICENKISDLSPLCSMTSRSRIYIRLAKITPIWHNFFTSHHMPSSVIANMNYDADKSRLTIRYVSGAVYEYLDVPRSEYLSMKKATSRGTYLNKVIKPKYHYKKVS